jgi:hypothetical protein
MSNKRMFLDPINGEIHDEDHFEGRDLDTLIEAHAIDDGSYAYEIDIEKLESMEIRSVKVLRIFANIVAGLGQSLDDEKDELVKHVKNDIVRRIAGIMLVKSLKLQREQSPSSSLH